MKKLYITLVIALLSMNVFGQVPNWAWADGASGNNYKQAYGIATDNNGNVIVAGSFSSNTITFGTTTLTNMGVYDMFLVKYDASGNVLWAKNAGGNSFDMAYGIATDKNGNIFVTGYFQSPTIVFDTITLTNYTAISGGYKDIFVVKYDPNGNVLWAKSAGGNYNDMGRSIATDSSGNVFVTGWFASLTMTIGTTTLTNADAIGPTADIFIVKYDSNGNILWVKSADAPENEWGNGIATDINGNVALTGYFENASITFGTVTLTNTSPDTADIYIVKYDASGNVLWAKDEGGHGMDMGNSIATDVNGNILVTGFFKSPSISFGTTILYNPGSFNQDMFIVKYNSSGNVLWAKRAGGSNWEEGHCVTSDTHGNVFLAGVSLSTSVTFDTTTLINTSGVIIFIVKYDSIGNVKWAKSIETDAIFDGDRIALNENEDMFVTGAYDTPSLVFGTTTLTNPNPGWYDFFVAKLDSGAIVLENKEVFKVEKEISIFPNPFTSTTNITFSEEQKNTSIKIMNVLGQTIQQYTINNHQSTIDMSGVSKGIYFVQITDEKKNVVNRKIVLQ